MINSVIVAAMIRFVSGEVGFPTAYQCFTADFNGVAAFALFVSTEA